MTNDGHSLPQTSGGHRIPPSRDRLAIFNPALEALVALADRFHRDPEVAVLIEGETGTGKELFCQRVHHGGAVDADPGPLVGINCAAIAPGLFEAELFGYEPGAFTGAAPGGNEGKLAMASGGTLFLDEVADLPLDQQAKLLRVLESRTWYRIGGDRLQPLQARVVCASNADLIERVDDGRFRRDLYYRLRVAHLRLPPLRESPAAIPRLAESLLDRIRQRKGRGFVQIEEEAAQLLVAYPWPGNVRQLLHFLEEACLLFDDEILGVEQVESLLPPVRAATAVIHRRETRRHRRAGTTLQDSDLVFAPTNAIEPNASAGTGSWAAPKATDLPEDGFDLQAWERRVISAALQKHGGSPGKTAEYLGITRKVLYTLRKRHGLL